MRDALSLTVYEPLYSRMLRGSDVTEALGSESHGCVLWVGIIEDKVKVHTQSVGIEFSLKLEENELKLPSTCPIPPASSVFSLPSRVSQD